MHATHPWNLCVKHFVSSLFTHMDMLLLSHMAILDRVSCREEEEEEEEEEGEEEEEEEDLKP
jgi:hypothetical protein